MLIYLIFPTILWSRCSYCPPYYRWGNKSPERLKYLSKITELKLAEPHSNPDNLAPKPLSGIPQCGCIVIWGGIMLDWMGLSQSLQSTEHSFLSPLKSQSQFPGIVTIKSSQCPTLRNIYFRNELSQLKILQALFSRQRHSSLSVCTHTQTCTLKCTYTYSHT